MTRWEDDSEGSRFADLLRDLTQSTGETEAPLTSSFHDGLIQADLNEAMREFYLPHVIVCFDPQSGHFTVEGPFGDGTDAIRMAEDDVLADRMSGTGFKYLVLPLLPRRDREWRDI